MFKKMLEKSVSYAVSEVLKNIDLFTTEVLKEAWSLGLNSKQRLEYRDYKLSLYGIEK